MYFQGQEEPYVVEPHSSLLHAIRALVMRNQYPRLPLDKAKTRDSEMWEITMNNQLENGRDFGGNGKETAEATSK